MRFKATALSVCLAALPAVAQHGHSATAHGAAMHQPMHSGTDSDSGRGKLAPYQRIEANPKLAQRISALLPANTDLETAASGFKNQGRFIAALHVYRNLDLASKGVSWTDFKNAMTSGGKPLSLGQAIHKFDSQANAKGESKKATHQAKDDVEASESDSSE